MEDNVERARLWFVEDLRGAAGIASPTILQAFARVPREKFAGPLPWRVGKRLMRLGGPLLEYQTFEGDAAVLYVRSPRADPHEEGESCWLHRDSFCLSYRQPD